MLGGGSHPSSTCRATAEALGPDIAERIAWIEGDLAVSTPPRDHFDLVVSLYVSCRGIAGRNGAAHGERGRARRDVVHGLHRPIDPTTGKPTAAASQVQVSPRGARRERDRGAPPSSQMVRPVSLERGPRDARRKLSRRYISSEWSVIPWHELRTARTTPRDDQAGSSD
jgi:hypothetical protein